MLHDVLIAGAIGSGIGLFLSILDYLDDRKWTRPMTWTELTPRGPVERTGTREHYYGGGSALMHSNGHRSLGAPEDDAPPAVWGGD